ncbi:MAG TPA: MBL fold metallo-hydrolase [Desulfotignum sp.]|nr:MBL fold metallo-hydrolase [Desulfotignum sp.]
MKFTVLGSGGCMVIPKPLCQCRICTEARQKGGPFERGGPAAFVHDENILIDTPAEICRQLNQFNIAAVSNLMLTHLDPDHIEGFRVVEQITIDFRTWEAHADKTVRLVMPRQLLEAFRQVNTAYGSLVSFYEESGFLRCEPFDRNTMIGDIQVTALPVDRGNQVAYIYVFEKNGGRAVYAPCDIKPFPEQDPAVQHPDVLFIQPGLFETRLRHGYVYPDDHISRTTLYTFEQTVALSRRIQAKQVVFIHLEEYWHRSFTDYRALEAAFDNMVFAWDGMTLTINERGK